MFNIITRKNLLWYCELYSDAKLALLVWYIEIERADFANFNELKKFYPTASLVGDDRVVFNIMGNHYRLIVRFSFEFRAVQVKWFGSHKEYDRIDVKTIAFKGGKK